MFDFFCGKLTKPCHYVTMSELSNWSATFHLVSQQSLTRIINNKLKIVIKRPPVATIIPSGMNTVIGALVYRVYLRIFDRGLSNTITFLGLCLPDDYRL